MDRKRKEAVKLKAKQDGSHKGEVKELNFEPSVLNGCQTRRLRF